MNIMTLNVWQGRLERVLLKHLKTLKVDFACMQESIDYDADAGGLVSSYKKIGKSLSLNEHFFSPLNTTKFGSKNIHFGNVIYSSIPFSRTNTVFTRGEYIDNFDFDSDDYNVRAFQHAEVAVGGKKLNLINHHGHHIEGHKLGDEETLRQVNQITDYIKNLDGGIIMCGDFNLSPESESIKHINNLLRNLSVEFSLETTRSQLTYKNEVCDYIFVNKNIKVNDFNMDDTIISDHNALLLDFDIV